jgi:putative resolvase
MIARGYQFEIIQDIGSGINYNKKDLNQLIDRITNGEIEIIDNTEKQELVEDLIQIVTVFSYRLQGKRANKAKKMIKELIGDDTS